MEWLRAQCREEAEGESGGKINIKKHPCGSGRRLGARLARRCRQNKWQNRAEKWSAFRECTAQLRNPLGRKRRVTSLIAPGARNAVPCPVLNKSAAWTRRVDSLTFDIRLLSFPCPGFVLQTGREKLHPDPFFTSRTPQQPTEKWLRSSFVFVPLCRI